MIEYSIICYLVIHEYNYSILHNINYSLIVLILKLKIIINKIVTII